MAASDELRLERPRQPWARSAEEICARLSVEPARGLSSDAAGVRRRLGENVMRQTERRGALALLVDQWKSFIVGLLACAAVLAFVAGEVEDAIAVLAVIVLNTVIGFVTELRAVRSMEALRALGSVHTVVRRGGRAQRIAAEGLVVGDIVLVEAGDMVTADLRLLSGSHLEADESALTGESMTVAKDAAVLPADVPLAERANLLFKGTAVTRGSGEAVVVAVGMDTELGRISALVQEARNGPTPLERRLDQLGRTLAWASLAFVTVVAIAGIAAGREVVFVIETAIALAVATVPEGLPIVATLALARGMWRMARRNALIEQLPAVETLGSTSVILTDKTGTLTENRMTVARVQLPAGSIEVGGTGLALQGAFERDGAQLDPQREPDLLHLLHTAALCTSAELGSGDQAPVGDPMEVALLVAAAKAGLHAAELRERRPELREEAFDPETRMMATFHAAPDGVEVAVKGAAEAVLEVCSEVGGAADSAPLEAAERQRWAAVAHAMGDDGLRVLAIADKRVDSAEHVAYRSLRLLGLIGLIDPPRSEVRAAIEACRSAGVRVVMVTGDHTATACNVARAVGLDDGWPAVPGTALESERMSETQGRDRLLRASVIARSSPEQKLRLLDLHQRAGAVVAMIGDGVNDAPALRKADIGVAMGKRGTQVAREAAAMVLQDDRFGTIVAAIEQGRVIFDNIRSFVVYLISCNLSEILTIGLASLVDAPLPILPLQILFLNLVTDVFPALALGAGEGDPEVMRRPPRERDEPFLTAAHWRRIAGFSLLLTVPVLASLALAVYGLGMSAERAVTVSFLVLAGGQLAHVFNMVAPGTTSLRNEVTRNPWVWAALALCAGLILVAVYVPFLSRLLATRHPGPAGWGLVLALSAVPALGGQLLRLWQASRGGCLRAGRPA